MENIIILALIVVLLILGVHSAVKHFKGIGGCCGGNAPMEKQHKTLQKVIAQKTVIIEGMTCEHCKNWVEKRINEIDGAAAKVNLRKKEAVVSMDREISDAQICAAVEKAGYKVVQIH